MSSGTPIDWRSERGRNGGVDRVVVAGTAGDLWLCGKHFVAPDHESALDRTGASRLLCLNEVGELAARYPDYVDWLRSDDDRGHWAPIPDMCAPELGTALSLVETVHTWLRGGEDVLVHCGAGIGRAGTMAAAVLIGTGLTADSAVELVARSRPMAGPERGEQRLLLDHLVDALAD